MFPKQLCEQIANDVVLCKSTHGCSIHAILVSLSIKMYRYGFYSYSFSKALQQETLPAT